MIKKNTATGEQTVGLSVVDCNPMRVQFGHRVRASRIKGCELILRHSPYLSIHLRRGSLIKLYLRIDLADRLQHASYTKSINVSRKERLLERNFDEALRS